MPPFYLFLVAGGVATISGLIRRDQTLKAAAGEHRPVSASDRNIYRAMIALGLIVFVVGVVLFVFRRLGQAA